MVGVVFTRLDDLAARGVHHGRGIGDDGVPAAVAQRCELLSAGKPRRVRCPDENASIGCSSESKGPNTATVAPSRGRPKAISPGQLPQLPLRRPRITGGPNVPPGGRTAMYVAITSPHEEFTVVPIAASPDGPNATTGETPGPIDLGDDHAALAGPAAMP